MTLDNAALPEVSVVVPVFNEQDNIAPLVHEITAALRGLLPFEIIYVDDCSRDDSREILKQLRMTVPELRVFGHTLQSADTPLVLLAGACLPHLYGISKGVPVHAPDVVALCPRLYS